MGTPPDLARVLTLREAGFHTFPMKPAPDKTPALRRWPERATRDEATIRDWWTLHPENGVGICTSRFRDDEGLIVVDVDVKDGKNGFESLIALELQGFDLPPTLTQETPSGGRHFIYRHPRPVKQGVEVLGPGLDIRSRGGYIVAHPGSELASGEIAPAPAWLVEKCGAPRPKAARKPSPAVVVNPESAHRRALDFLATLPPATAGSRNDTGYKVAAHLKDIGVGRDECAALMAEHWKCEPPLDLAELEHVVSSAFTYGENAQGSAAPEADFEPVKAGAAKQHIPAWVKEMNEQYAVTCHHGKTMIHEIVEDHELGHSRHEWLTSDDFKRRHVNETVTVTQRNGTNRAVPKGDAWIEHPARRQYRAEAFLPGHAAPDGVLNLWNGFAVKPKAGGWRLLKSHIREVICDGDRASFEYVMGWLALLVQKPGEQGQVALVLQGGEGTGKGTFGAALLGLFGQHGLHITQPKHLTGAFNSHLRDKVFVFADEAFFAGNPEHRGPLYALITEDKIQIEAKGVDAKTARNVLHILMATNSDWAVPAGVNARRFCVLRVSESRRQDNAYFRAVRDEMKNGGLEAMLRDLLAFDLSGFNVFDVPMTAALTSQKLLSLKGPEAWLLDCLQHGRIGTHEWTDRGVSVSRTDAYDSYKSASKLTRDPARDISTWGRILRNVLGENVSDRRPWESGQRPRKLMFGGFTAARHAFERHVGSKIEWETESGEGSEAFPPAADIFA